MAKGNFREYLKNDYVKTKKYFYVLRPVLCMRWIEANHSIPPLRFETLVEKTVTDDGLKSAIAELLARKKAGFETDYDRPIKPISDFLETELARLGESVNSVVSLRKTSDEADSCFKNYLAVV
jgi:predicted nucleotidyltransferase